MSGTSLHESRDHSFADAAMSALLAEIRRLQRWKADAIAVLNMWDDAFERADITGLLGARKPDLMVAVTSNDRAVLEEIAARFTLLRIDAESLRRQVDTWAKMAARILESDVQSNVHSRILELVSRLRTERDEHKELVDRHRRAMDQQRQEIAQLQRDLADVRAKPVRKTTRPKVAAS